MSLYSQLVGSWKSLLIDAFALTALYGVYKIIDFVLIIPLFSPLNDLPGPKSPSFIYGHFRQIFKAGPGELHKKWAEEYGPTLASRHPCYLFLRSWSAECLLRSTRRCSMSVPYSYKMLRLILCPLFVAPSYHDPRFQGDITRPESLLCLAEA